MKQEELFLSIEQCKHLQELGLDMSDGAFGWSFCPTLSCGKQGISRFIIIPSFETNPEYEEGDFIYTYTLQEIIDKLPNWIVIQLPNTELHSQLTFEITEGFSYVCKSPITVINHLHREEYDYNPLNDAYKMLCYVIEQGYLKVKDNE